ncbi:unnamed protein product [Lampetra planeri]
MDGSPHGSSASAAAPDTGRLRGTVTPYPASNVGHAEVRDRAAPPPETGMATRRRRFGHGARVDVSADGTRQSPARHQGRQRSRPRTSARVGAPLWPGGKG